ncbi:pentapeptide repeat-containing protein [Streptomyces collinus]|uniref:pentapeptide repeat-containing protein n=1 Tax=Streptomyces collinus TaxID=42684 RepID=UPI0036B17D7B
MAAAARQPAVIAPVDRWTRIQQAAGTLAALGTLAVIVFTWLSIQQVDDEHALTREGQVTDRYNAAVTNIGEDSLEVRLGGIYALQRIMEDSPRDQPSIVDVLSTYIRNRAKKPKQATDASNREPASDIQAALTALGSRDPAHDGTARVDLRATNLSGADLSEADLSQADLSEADLSGAGLHDADLSIADLSNADLSNAGLHGADLSQANLSEADLFNANLSHADLRGAGLPNANLRSANLSDSDLAFADLAYADLSGADLSGAFLSGADLRGAKLPGATGP